jgi:hypothetical protein
MNKFMKTGLVALIILSSATIFTYAGKPPKTRIIMETREDELYFSMSDTETITYPEIRHVSLSIQARELDLAEGDSFYVIIQLPGSVGSLVLLDDEFHNLEFDTNEWRIGVGLFYLDHTVKVVYYATETYMG